MNQYERGGRKLDFFCLFSFSPSSFLRTLIFRRQGKWRAAAGPETRFLVYSLRHTSFIHHRTRCKVTQAAYQEAGLFRNTDAKQINCWLHLSCSGSQFCADFQNPPITPLMGHWAISPCKGQERWCTKPWSPLPSHHSSFSTPWVLLHSFEREPSSNELSNKSPSCQRTLVSQCPGEIDPGLSKRL